MADVFWVLEIIMGPKSEIYTFSQVKEITADAWKYPIKYV